MGAGYHGGFGKTKGAGKSILYAKSKETALIQKKLLPLKIRTSYIKYVKNSTTSKYIDYRVSRTDIGYLYQSKKPGEVPGSYAVYYKEVDLNGQTIRVYKDTYDNKGILVHRKYK